MARGFRVHRFSGRTSRARRWGLLVISTGVILGVLGQIRVPVVGWLACLALALCGGLGGWRKSARILLVLGSCALALGLMVAGGTSGRGTVSAVDRDLQRFRVEVRSVREGTWPSGSRWVNLLADVSGADSVGSDPALAPRSAAPLSPGMRVQVLFSRAGQAWAAGDRIELVGRPESAHGLCNAGGDDRLRSLRARGIDFRVRVKDDRSVVRLPPSTTLRVRVRQMIGQAIDRAASGRSAAVLRALVLGDRQSLGREQRANWAAAGVAHLLVVSGLHLAVVLWAGYRIPGFLLHLFLPVARVRLARLLAQVSSFLLAGFYLVIVGDSVSLLRAAIVALFMQSREFFGGMVRPLHFLAATAAGFLLVDPDYAYDPGFQLTFVATAALMAGGALGLARPQKGRVGRAPARISRGDGLWQKSGRAIRFSLWVVLATAPILLHHFGEFSMGGVLTNVLLGPILGAGVLSLALPGALLAPIAPEIAVVLLGQAAAVIETVEPLILWIGASRFGVFGADAMGAVVWFSGLVTLGFWQSNGPRFFLLGGLLVLAVIVVHSPRRPPALDALRVHFLDVGQGDGIVVAGPGAPLATLVDLPGRLSPPALAQRVLSPVLRRAGLAGLERIIASHADWDHAGGLAAVEELYPGAEILVSRWNAAPDGGRGLAQASPRTIHHLAAGDGFALGEARAEVLQPGADSLGGRNDNSLVIVLAFGATRVLLTGDIERRAEEELRKLPDLPGVSVLKVPHHGSRTSSGAALLARLRPSIAVAQLAGRNRFGFPHEEVVARYASFGSAWLSTAADGEVELVSDGQMARLRPCRGDD